MSWSFSFTAHSEDEAKAKLDELADTVPDPVVLDITKSMIAALPDEPDTVVIVSSFGHFSGNQHGGTSNMQIAVSQNYKSAVDAQPKAAAEGDAANGDEQQLETVAA